MRLLTVLFSILSGLHAVQAMAGGGGCGGEPCSVIPNDILGECEMRVIRTLNEDALKLGTITAQVVTQIRNSGLRVQLRGDARTIRSSKTPFLRELPFRWETYRGKDPIDLNTGIFQTIQYYSYVYSISYRDPRPIVTAFLIEIANHPGKPHAEMSLVQRGYFDPKDPWRTSDVAVLDGEMDCRILKTPQTTADEN